MAKTFHYDKENDILAIHKGFLATERFKGNIEAGDLILDVSTQGRVRGVEIMDTSKFFKQVNVDKKVFENLTDADFKASSKPSGIVIGIALKAKNVKKEIQRAIAVPLEIPRMHR